MNSLAAWSLYYLSFLPLDLALATILTFPASLFVAAAIHITRTERRRGLSVPRH